MRIGVSENEHFVELSNRICTFSLCSSSLEYYIIMKYRYRIFE